METHLRDHYACGDIVTFPCRSSVTTKAQCGHFGMAQKMGHIAALAMADRQPESIIETVPFFWTTVAGVTLRYVGKYTAHICLHLSISYLLICPRLWRALQPYGHLRRSERPQVSRPLQTWMEDGGRLRL